MKLGAAIKPNAPTEEIFVPQLANITAPTGVAFEHSIVFTTSRKVVAFADVLANPIQNRVPRLLIHSEDGDLRVTEGSKEPDGERPSRCSVLFTDVYDVPPVTFDVAENLPFAFIKLSTSEPATNVVNFRMRRDPGGIRTEHIYGDFSCRWITSGVPTTRTRADSLRQLRSDVAVVDQRQRAP